MGLFFLKQEKYLLAHNYLKSRLNNGCLREEFWVPYSQTSGVSVWLQHTCNTPTTHSCNMTARLRPQGDLFHCNIPATYTATYLQHTCNIPATYTATQLQGSDLRGIRFLLTVTVYVAGCVVMCVAVCVAVWVAECVAECIAVCVAVCVAACVAVWVAMRAARICFLLTKGKLCMSWDSQLWLM